MLNAGARHVVVVGGGITGLAAAYTLGQSTLASSRLDPAAPPLQCTLVEASSRLGGKILTERVEGFLVEGGPDSFLAQKPWGIDLCRRLELSESLIGTNPEHRKTFVLLGGRLRELPEGLIMGLPTKFGPFFRSDLLSWTGKLRMVSELFRSPAGHTEDESLASFFRRRLGEEALDRIIEPLLTGIYTGDAEQLSLLATFPRFREMERESGSLVRAVLRAKSKTRTGEQRTLFLTLRDGLGMLIKTLTDKTPHTTLLTNRRVQELRRRHDGSGYDVLLSDGRLLTADAVIITTPAFDGAALLKPLDAGLSNLLADISYTSSVTVSLGFHQKDIETPLDGYGFVVPRIEHRPLIASTWTSSKWAHRAPPGAVLLRCFFGGVGRESVLEKSDSELVQMACDELRRVLKLQQAPMLARVYRWPDAMPQYHVGHLQKLDDIAERLQHLPGLLVAGAAYRGVGLPDCIRDGTLAAESILRDFDKRATASV